MKALVLIDHGSKKKAANDLLFDVVKKVADRSPDLIVEGAHMELAAPSILDAITRCVERGATHIGAMPYMLGPGRHVQEDIPELVEEAANHFKEIEIKMVSYLGENVPDKLVDVILERATEV